MTGADLMHAAHGLGLDLAQLAAAAGVSERALVSWAAGKTTPRLSTRGLVEAAIRRLQRAKAPAPAETTQLDDTRRELARARMRLAQAQRRNDQMRRALEAALEEAA